MAFYMNVLQYASNYKGRNQILRLIHVANQCTDPMYAGGNTMELEALRTAYDLIVMVGEETLDFRLFKIVAEKIGGRLGETYPLDQAYCSNKKWEFDSLKRSSEVMYGARLRHGYLPGDCDRGIDPEQGKIEDAIRHYNFLYNCGFLSGNTGRHLYDSFEALGITDPPMEACLSAILVALETRSYDCIRNRTPAMSLAYEQHEDFRFKVDCASALADLGEEKYYSAAEGFVKLFDSVHNYDYSEVLSPEDLLTYGLVCAMATFDRVKLLAAVSKVKEPTGVVYQLREIVKPYGVVHNLIEIINNFVAQDQFTNCIELFQKQKPRLLLDIYLSGHVGYLCSEIHDLMVAGYLRSFSTIMVDNFTVGMMAPSKEQEELRIILDSGGLVVPESQVLRLMESNKIQGRIEEHDRCKFFSPIVAAYPSEGMFSNFTAPQQLSP